MIPAMSNKGIELSSITDTLKTSSNYKTNAKILNKKRKNTTTTQSTKIGSLIQEHFQILWRELLTGE